ncbi:MAG: hypothetical protein JW839_04730 [Candidatus Lokiarchaeota archaeon]|nr:hypothetical protein [Candidatus Lokiarchaeota archaeon]
MKMLKQVERGMTACHEPQRRARDPASQKSMIKVWKSVPLLCTFFFSVLLFVCLFCVKETISVLPFLASYIDAGKSFFLPFVPQFNLFFFLPDEAQVLPFTIGHLIDFIIVVNIIIALNPIAFPFYKRVSREYYQDQFFDLQMDYIRPRQEPAWILLDARSAILLRDRCELEVTEELVFGKPSFLSVSNGRLIPRRGQGRAHGRLHPAASVEAAKIHEQAASRAENHPQLPSKCVNSSQATRSRVALAIFSSIFSTISTPSARHRP